MVTPQMDEEALIDDTNARSSSQPRVGVEAFALSQAVHNQGVRGGGETPYPSLAADACTHEEYRRSNATLRGKLRGCPALLKGASHLQRFLTLG